MANDTNDAKRSGEGEHEEARARMARSCGARRVCSRKSLEARSLGKSRESLLRGLSRAGWESRLARCAAISLSILEVKRLLLLSVEMLTEGRAVRFAGALSPVLLSFLDAGLGFPLGLSTVYAMRRQEAEPSYSRGPLRRLAFMLLLCAGLNLATILLAAYQVNLRPDTLRDIFRASMRFYASRASYKLTIDELQLDLDCCGALAFSDWFNFDWQGIDYLDDADKLTYSERSVPYSCCKKRTLMPCIHQDMRRENLKTIHSRGCAIVLSRLLMKIIVIGYAMTGLVLLSQITTICLLVKIIQKNLPEFSPSECSCCESMCTMKVANLSCSSDECGRAAAAAVTATGKGKANREHGGSGKIHTIVQPRKVPRRKKSEGRGCRSSSSASPSSRHSLLSYSSSSSASSVHLSSSPSLDEARPIPFKSSSGKCLPNEQRRFRPFLSQSHNFHLTTSSKRNINR